MIDISFPLEPALFNCPRSPSLACTAACARCPRPRLPLSYSRRRRRCVVCCCSFLLGCVLAYLPHSRHDRYHLYHHVDVASDCRCRPSSRSRCISTLVVISQRCGAVRVCARAAMIEISSGLCACACAPMSASTSTSACLPVAAIHSLCARGPALLRSDSFVPVCCVIVVHRVAIIRSFAFEPNAYVTSHNRCYRCG